MLWDLLEKKFRDLGEFVEGKEKMKIVVHKTYESVKDLNSLFSTFEKGDFDVMSEGNDPVESREDEEGLIKLEDDLQQDITQLAQEEMVMISQGTEGEDDDGGDPSAGGEMSSQNPNGKVGPGQTEEDAICIIDDDDDGPGGKTSEKKDLSRPADKSPSQHPGAVESSSGGDANQDFDPSNPFDAPRLYSQTFEGDAFGIQLFAFHGRIVVGQNTKGSHKPAPGDIVAAVNGMPMPYDVALSHVLSWMRRALCEGPVEVNFVEDERFIQFFTKVLLAKTIVSQNESSLAARPSPPPPVVEHEDGVIELIDDD